MKTKKDLVVDAIFLIALAVSLAVLIWGICDGGNAEATQEPTTQATTEETTEYITEPTETEEATEESTEVIPAIPLYDVPLDAELQLHIIHTAEEKRIDPAIIMAMAFKESTYTPSKIGDGGNSYGLLQVQVKWHYDRMLKLGCTDLLDPYQNVTVAVDYLAEQIDRYGDLARGLTSYNAGSYNGTISNYAKTVISMAEEMAVK